jgi:hypothetical protein
MVTQVTFTITAEHIRTMLNNEFGIDPGSSVTIVAAEIDDDGDEIVRIKPDTLTIMVETDLGGAKRIERKLKKTQL